MTPERAKTFLMAIGRPNAIQRGSWVTSSCPLALWTHKSGKDSTPSFGLSLGKNSRYNCFACGKGSVEELLGAVELYAKDSSLGLDFKLARSMLDEEFQEEVSMPEYLEFPSSEEQEFQELPEYWLESFQSIHEFPEAVLWLAKRDNGLGVPVYQWSEFDLKYDPSRSMVVAPFRNVFGKLAGARGRSILSGVTGWQKHWDYSWNKIRNTRLVWFNEQALQYEGPVVVVEGQFDCMRVSEKYRKVVANLTALPTWPKMQRLLQSNAVILICDNDEAGEKAEKEYRYFCTSNNLFLSVLSLPIDVKDPGECHPDWLYEQIKPLLGLTPY